MTAAELLDLILAGAPAERTLTVWARSSRFAGSKDRVAVRDHVYEALRSKRSLAALGGEMSGRGLSIGLARRLDLDLATIFTGKPYAPAPLSDDERNGGGAAEAGAEALDLPDWLMPLLANSLGEALTSNATAMIQRAPVILRANLQKTSRQAARDALAEDNILTCDHQLSETAIEVVEGQRRVANSTAYKSGLVEIQDASSQAAVDTVPLQDGQRVLDYCAGGGGKLLALAGRAKAQFFAHDINPQRMKDLPVRAERAGVQADILQPDDLATSAAFDLVFCDAPCSGSGTWRRTPDAKWRFSPQDLAELTDTQDEILNQASDLVAPEGVLSYATCSLLDEENDQRIEAFLQAHPEWHCLSRHRWDLQSGGDGFFIAHLTRSP